MTKEKYEKMIDYFERSKVRSLILECICKIFPALCAAVYAAFIILLAIFRSGSFLKFVLIPLITFILVTVIRKLINRQRPYEALGYTPFLKYKEGKGQSFPSRHCASAFIIAFACMSVHIGVGIGMLVVAALIGASRFVSGMHYLSDVLAGILFSLFIAVLGFVVL